MIQQRVNRFNRRIQRTFFNSSCSISSPNGDGTWEDLGEYPCNVQADIIAPSVEDRRVSMPNDVKQVSIFLLPSAPVGVGYRCMWNGKLWNMGADTEDRSVQGMVRVILTDWQVAVEPEPIAFWRFRDGERVDIGTFEVRVILDDMADLMGEPRSEFAGDTATGATESGTMIGDTDIAVLYIGDWFSRNGYPGRIVDINQVDPERVKAVFTIDRGKV